MKKSQEHEMNIYPQNPVLVQTPPAVASTNHLEMVSCAGRAKCLQSLWIQLKHAKNVPDNCCYHTLPAFRY